MRLVSVFSLIFYSAISLAQMPSFQQAEAQLMDILRPHVVSLDRNLVLFRYEEKDPQHFHPSTQQDIVDREYNWSKRFFDENVAGNPDGGGPGLYTSTDPTATATWGVTAPGLFVFTLKKNSNVLIGDTREVTESIQNRVDQIYSAMNCGDNHQTQKPADFSSVITSFRNADNVQCRKLIIETIQKLQVRAITYSFYSSPLENCRATGTAINVIWPDALELSRINYYSENLTIAGDSTLTPFVKMLFDEGKQYFFSQTVMADEQMLAKWHNDNGFFVGVTDVDRSTYEQWKSEHILRCGSPWPTERPDFRAVTNLNARHNADWELQQLFAKTALAYNQRNFQWQDPKTSGAETEFFVGQMRQIEDLQYKQLQVSTQQLPKPEWKRLKDSGDFESLNRIAKLLDENMAANYAEFNRMMVESLKQIAPSHYNDPLLMAVMFSRAGFGPKISAMAFNQNQFMHGTIPILEGPLPKKFGDERALLAHNRALFMNILNQCLNIYSDQKISNQQVYDGPCGVINANNKN